jgi:ribosome-associated protein
MIETIEFKLTTPYIELIKLLKLVRLAATGGHAQIMVVEEQVKLNGQIELRKRAKLVAGDLVETPYGNIKIVE